MYRSQSQSEAMLAIPSGNLIDENRTKILINCEQIYMEKKLTTYIIDLLRRQ